MRERCQFIQVYKPNASKQTWSGTAAGAAEQTGRDPSSAPPNPSRGRMEHRRRWHFLYLWKNLLFFHMRNLWQEGSAQLALLHLLVLFGLGSLFVCLFLRKGQSRKIQDSTRCPVHRLYTPLALSYQRTPVPKTTSDARGRILGSRPCYFGMDGTFYIPNAHSDTGRLLNIFFRTSNQIANIATKKCLMTFKSRMADLKTDIYWVWYLKPHKTKLSNLIIQNYY